MSDYKRPYLFTNEYLSVYYPMFNLKNKRVLTVGSSCDQTFNAYYYGAKEVIIYDLCSYTELIYSIKYASLMGFSYEEFLEFYNLIPRNKVFDYNMFQSIKNYIKDFYCYNYWNNQFNSKGHNSRVLYDIAINFFPGDYIINMNSYLQNEDNYNKMKEIIRNKKPMIINDNLTNIDYHINTKVNLNHIDFANLSNIYNNIGHHHMLNIVKSINGILNINGDIILDYYFYPNIGSEVFDKSKIITFDTYSGQNAILTYKKK